MTLQAEASATLARWYAAKPALALMGEFSAGKSTLLNLLLGGDHMPTKVTATNLPSVWVTYSETPFTQGLRHDGTLEDIVVEDLGEDVREQFLVLRYGLSADILKRADIIDTPGISDPKLAKGATLFLGPFLDAVLWLSPANQAWRQTEKTVWTDFPKGLHQKSMVVLTRADKMRKATDLSKVMRRVKRETKGLFSEQVALNTPLAAEHQSQPDAPEWEASGGKLFFAALEKILADAVGAQLERYTAPIEAPPAKPSKAAAKKPARAKVTAAKGKSKASQARKKAAEFSALAVFEEELARVNRPTENCQIISIFEQITARLNEHSDINPVHKMVLNQCLRVGGQENVERLIEQARSEMADFDQDFWCVIAP